jgi:hypothetical protein
MLDLLSSTKLIKDQSATDKIHLLKTIAHQMLGAKWIYYRKIKNAGEGFKLFREKSLMELMKATQAALRFTSRHASKAYRTAYKTCLNEIRKNTIFKPQDFPTLDEGEDRREAPSLGPEHDEVIISWTPLKFLLPARTIREKGVATEPHSEGLVAKLFFKVVGYYAIPENWDREKLTFYLRRIDQNASFQDVSAALAPLKEDLLKFTEAFVPFKFGKAAAARGKTSDDNVFEDDLGESFEDQLRTLYWYHFIYWAMKLFLLRYYLIMISSTSSVIAIRMLSRMFKPAILKVIENLIIFEGSLETDQAKKKFRRPYQEYMQKKQLEQEKKKIKTKNGIFETYNYTLNLLEKQEFDLDIDQKPAEDSQWREIIKNELLNARELRLEQGTQKSEPVPQHVIDYAILQVLNLLINATQYKRKAHHKILVLFKKRVAAEREQADRRVEELRREGDKYILSLERKISKLQRMQQKESAEVFRKDIELFRKRLDEKCASIIEMTQQQVRIQKRRFQTMLQKMMSDQDISEGVSAKYLLNLIAEISPQNNFMREFIKHIAEHIQNDYDKDLEPFYHNMFDILTPSVQEKVVLIQSLEKAGVPNGVKLSLTEEEKEENRKIIELLKQKIKKTMPDIFDCKVVFQTTLISIEDLYAISLNNESLKALFSLKVMSKRQSKPVYLNEKVVKILLLLNLVKNPVPKHNVLQPEWETMKDPVQMINGTLLTQLVKEQEQPPGAE